MPNMRMSAVFKAMGAIVAIIVLPILSGCTTTNNVTLTCNPSGPNGDPDGPGISCGSNKTEVANNTSVAPNAIPVLNGVPTGGTIPNGSTCYSASPNLPKSYKCKAAAVGASCTIPAGAKKCRDTWDTSTRVCDCLCISS